VSIQYQIKTENRDRLYYDKFCYSFQIRQTEIFALRGLPDAVSLMKFVHHRKRWMLGLINQRNRYDDYFTEQSTDDLVSTLELLSNHPTEFKMTVSGDWASFYSNDLTLMDRLQRLPYVKSGRVIKQAVINRAKDVVVIQNPEYQYRTYLKERKMSQERRQQLLSWIQAQHDQEKVHARASKALLSWLKNSNTTWRSDWTQRYYYIEHNDPRYETMISMIVPGFIRKSSCVISTAENCQMPTATK
jgi:hypothetical protein